MYAVSGIPVSIIIDREGIIKYRGNVMPENIELLLKQML